jgi:Tfp pilus assembly protein FimT
MTVIGVRATVVVAALAGLASGVALPAQTPILRPGQYERTTELTMTGRGKLPPRKTTDCVSADDVNDFSRKLRTRERSEQCTTSNHKQTDTSVSYTQECTTPDGNRVTFNATVTFTAESYQAVVTTSSTGGQAAAVSPLFAGSTMTITGKRIGDCAK